MKRENSETTTMQKEQLSKTGTQDGEAGSAKKENLPRVVAWLLKRSSVEVDNALRLLATSRGVAFRMDNNGYRPTFCAVGSPDALKSVQRDIEKALAPAPREVIVEWLVEVEKLVIPRQLDDMDAGLTIRAYLDRLIEYPADITRDVLLGWHGKFFPTWNELKEQLDRSVAQRNRMLNALRCNLGTPVQPDEETSMTDDEKAKLQADVAVFVKRAISPAKVPPAQTPHWTKSCADDDPRMEHLQQARADDPLVAAARARQAAKA